VWGNGTIKGKGKVMATKLEERRRNGKLRRKGGNGKIKNNYSESQE
jgi:hypothetical protein